MILRIVSFSLFALLAAPALAQPDGATIYADLCASCHAETRLGGSGPALIPESLGRLRKAEAEKVIKEGRPASQMLGFGEKLSAGDVIITGSITPPIMLEDDETEIGHALDPIGEVSVNFTRD